MDQSDNGQNVQKNGDNQHRIWNVSYTAIAVWCWLITVVIVRLWVYDHVPDIYKAQAFIESILTLAIVDVIVVHAVMYYKQAKEANKQGKIAGDALIIAHTARLGVHSVTSQLQAGRSMSIHIENVGTVPAFGIEVTVELASLIAEHIVRKIPKTWPSHYFKHTEVFGRTQLLPGNFKPRVAIDPEKCFSQQERDLFAQPNSGSLLAVRVHIEWRDGFEQGVQKADFAFAYDYELPVDQWIPSDPDASIFELAKDDQRRRNERNAQQKAEK